MDDLLSEKEQIERLREWWSENGSWVIAGIVLGVGAVVGWNYWQGSRTEARVEASMRFEDLAGEVSDNSLEGAETIAAEILTDYPATIYADQARLAMASLYMDQGRDADAARELRALIESGNDERMKMVARLRLAKVLLYQGRPEEVVELLDGFGDSGFAARYAEAIGDAHYELGDFAAAEAAYLRALETGSAGQLIDPQLVQMKINDLPETSADGMLDTPVPADRDGQAAAATDPAAAPAGAPADAAGESASVPADGSGEPAAASGTGGAAEPAEEPGVEPADKAGNADEEPVE